MPPAYQSQPARPPHRPLQPPSAGINIWAILASLVCSLGALAVVGYFLLPGFNSPRSKSAKLKQAAPVLTGELTMSERIAITKLGQDLAGSLNRGSSYLMSGRFDSKALIERALEPLPDTLKTERMQQRILQAFEAEYSDRQGGWLKDVLGMQAAFVRIAERKGSPVALLRLLPKGGGVVFIGLLIRRQPGTPVVMDVYHYVTGLSLSQHIGARMIMLHSDADPGILGSIFGYANIDQSTLGTIKAIVAASKRNDHALVLRLCDSLPERHHDNKHVYAMRLEALGHVWNKSPAYEQQYRDLLRQAPEVLGPDTVTDLLLSELLTIDKRYAEAEVAAKHAEEVIGVDGYLKLMRASLRFLQNDFEGAEKVMKEAELADNGLEDLIYLKLRLLMLKRDYPAMMAAVTYFESLHRKNFDRSFLTKNAEFADFVASPPYQAWLLRNPVQMPSILHQLNR